MTFDQQVALAADPQFRLRVRGAAVTAAVSVMADRPADCTAEALDVHRRRAALAREVLLDPDRITAALVIGIASNPGMPEPTPDQAVISDNDIAYTVSTMWNAYAGVVLPPS